MSLGQGVDGWEYSESIARGRGTVKDDLQKRNAPVTGDGAPATSAPECSDAKNTAGVARALGEDGKYEDENPATSPSKRPHTLLSPNVRSVLSRATPTRPIRANSTVPVADSDRERLTTVVGRRPSPNIDEVATESGAPEGATAATRSIRSEAKDTLGDCETPVVAMGAPVASPLDTAAALLQEERIRGQIQASLAKESDAEDFDDRPTREYFIKTSKVQSEKPPSAQPCPSATDSAGANSPTGASASMSVTATHQACPPLPESPPLTVVSTTGQRPDGAPMSAGLLMDEPPHDEESDPFASLNPLTPSPAQVSLVTADDTAEALRRMRAQSESATKVDIGRGARLSAANRELEATSESIQPVVTTTTQESTQLGDVQVVESVEPGGLVASTPESASPSMFEDEQHRTAGLDASRRATRPDLVISAATKSPTPNKGGSTRTAWGGATVAFTIAAAWWFISPPNAPAPDNTTENGAAPPFAGASPSPISQQSHDNRTVTSRRMPQHTGAIGKNAADDQPVDQRPIGDGKPTIVASHGKNSPLPTVDEEDPKHSGEVEAKPLDKEAARAALREAAMAAGRCRIQGDPSGWTRVTVRFENSGRVKSAQVLLEPFKDTHTAHCIEAKVSAITVSPFDGAEVTMTHPIEVF